MQRRDEPSLEERAGAFDLTSAFLPPIIALLLSYILSLLFGWQLGLTVGLTSIFLYILFLAIVIFGGYAKNWKKAIEIGETAARYSRSWRLILDILFNQPPRGTYTPQHVRLIPVTLNLGASYTAWDAAVQLSEKMWAAAATRYSMLAMHLQWAGKDIPSKYCLNQPLFFRPPFPDYYFSDESNIRCAAFLKKSHATEYHSLGKDD
ncbi:unnamed protein product [Dibothriocephalus latus]|uniref:Uncharacterized protein n=1 Tax=Dibothriocephalus latus TaxID=60516 RepID=A0A3P6SWF4_DIBLA|nr:unnamed protein product [Dibothriocephalus latus]